MVLHPGEPSTPASLTRALEVSACEIGNWQQLWQPIKLLMQLCQRLGPQTDIPIDRFE